MKLMSIGRRRHKVTIEYDPGTTTNAYGELTADWTTYSTQWAAIEPVSAKEQLAGPDLIGTVTHQVTIPYVSGITGKMRVAFGSRYLYLVGPPIDRDERHRELTLLCVEKEA